MGARVSAILSVDDNRYLIARTVSNGNGVRWHLDSGSYSLLFDEWWAVEVPDGWAVADLVPGATGDIRVALTALDGSGWRLQSLVPDSLAGTLGAIVDEAVDRPLARFVEPGTGAVRVVTGAGDGYRVAGRDRMGSNAWITPDGAPGSGATRALARALSGDVWAAGERLTEGGSAGSVDRIGADGQLAASHGLSFGTGDPQVRISPVALQATTDGGVVVAAGAAPKQTGGTGWSGTLLRRLGPDGALVWERRYAGWDPLALVRLADQVRLVATRKEGDCNLGVLTVTHSDPAPACTPACPPQSCGDDGCGGSCGPCIQGLVCEDGGCFRPAAIAYPPDPASSGFAASGCDTNWSLDVFDWVDRPSSGRTCYLDPATGESPEKGTWLPCLPWETCDAAASWSPGAEELHIAGTRLCGRSCGPGVPCPFGAACKPTGLPYSDYIPEPIRLCAAPDQGSQWPPDPLGGPAAAEGGLGCWTTVAAFTGRNGSSRLAVVGSHVYVLAWNAGWKVDGTSVFGHLLQHAPLQPDVPATGVTVVAEAAEADGASTFWTGIRESGGRLLALERPMPEGPEDWGDTVEHQVLWGIPAVDGTVSLSPSGAKLVIADEGAAPVPGARHGCLVRLADDNDLVLVCFPVQDGKLAVIETPLSIPGALRDYIAWYRLEFQKSPIYGRPSLLAVSDRWIVAVTGDPCQDGGPAWQVHAAPFDPEAAQVTGTWTSWPLPAGLLPVCQSPGAILAYRDTLLLGGLSSRLSAAGPGLWVATTPRMAGYSMDWTVAGDLVISLDLLGLTGPDPLPARVVANRILW